MTPNTLEAAAALAAIDNLGGVLQVARALALGGRAVDLAGLDQQAARVCVVVGLLPPEDAQPLRAALLGVVRDVDALRSALTDPGHPPDLAA